MKKLNLFSLMLLLIGQTILGPIATVSASELPPINQDEIVEDGSDGNEEMEGGSSGDPVIPEAGEGEGEVDSPTPPDTDGEEIDKEETLPETETKPEEDKNCENEGLIEEGDTSECLEDEEQQKTQLFTATSQEITGATLSSFKMTIDGQEVGSGGFSQELEQDTIANFEVKFTVPMQDDNEEAWGDGSWFEFQLPNSLIDFESAFLGSEEVEGITYTYNTVDNTVRVELSGMEPGTGSPHRETLTINFKSGFNNLTDDIEQDLVIPATTGGMGTIKATFTFQPSTSDEKVKKKATGSPTPGVDGNHVMEWEVWVNEAGKVLNDASLIDSAMGGHAIVDGSVNVSQYTVDLKGVQNKAGSGTPLVTGGSWAAINPVLTGRNAYKITYKTAVNLDAEDRDGPKNFSNTVTFTNDGQPNETSNSATQTITYGKALKKHNGTGNNYTKNWRIDYNHNLLNIPADKASLEDTISGPHDIDFSSIKVYKMNDANGNVETNVSSGTDVTNNFTVSHNTGDSKTFTIDFGGNTSDAYTITYESKYNNKDFLESAQNGTYNNTVTNGAGKSNLGTYNLSENLLTKSHTIDVDNKTITWTINITSDNPDKAISNLTLTDTFTNGDFNGEHELVANSVKLNGVDATYSLTDADSTKGFTITGINVPAGQTAIVTYKTSFAIGDDGQVETQGYGNTATTEWTSGGVDYTKTARAQYEPGITTVNNGSKSGSFNYSTREFTWDVRVNINKKDIQGAVLVDTVGDGHDYVPGSTIEVFPLTNFGGNDTGGTIGTTPIDASNYDITVESDRGFTLTFKPTLDSSINNQAYVVRYKTIDSDNIIGIGSTTAADKGNVYENNATFQTKGDQTFILGSTPATLDENVANNLITKRNPNQNSATEKITWTLDVNKSHSNLGTNVELTDLPGDNLWLLEDSIRIATYNVTAYGISNKTDWQTLAQRGISVTFNADGGFTLTFPSLENVGYQVQYETIGFGQSGSLLENTATLHYGGQTENNQKTDDKFSGAFNFSSSDSSLTSTRGSAKFKKIGIDSETGEVKDAALAGVEFQLVKKTASNEYIIKTATTDTDGEITFENVPYNNYLVREVAAPTDYTQMGELEFRLDATTTLDQNPDLVTVLVNTTQLPAGSCNEFTIKVKGVNGGLITSGKVTLVDKNGKETELQHPLDADGKVSLPMNFPAGKYQVTHETEGPLGDVTVKYDSECEGEVAPAPTCDDFTITLKNKLGEGRSGIKVKLVLSTDDNVSIEKTTGTDGTFTVPTTKIDPGTTPGLYKVYEGNQLLGTVNITYVNCAADIELAPTCETFALTVRDVDGKPREAGVSIKIQDKNDSTKTYTGATDVDGKVNLTSQLPAGEYEVYEGTSPTPFDEFMTNTDCAASVQPAPTCTLFTLTVKDENGNARSGVKVTVRDTDGNAIPTNNQVTDVEGKITLPTTTKPGNYKVYEGEVFLGEITVSYQGGCNDEIKQAPTCPDFTLVVQDINGFGRPNLDVTLKDRTGTIVVGIGTTEGNGVVKFPTIKAGTYTVYEGNIFLGSFTVKDKCSALVKPTPPNPGPTNPGTPGEPNEPNKPVDPTKPGEKSEVPVDPNKPGEKPEVSVDPNKTGEKPELPIDPNKPGEEPENPVDPDTSDPNNPSNVVTGNEQGEGGKPGKDNTAKDPNASVHGAGGENAEGGLLGKDGKLNSQVANAGAEQATLPQTGEQNMLYMMIFGCALILLGGVMLGRRKTNEESAE